MISRRQLRIKVMQTLFAYFNSGIDSIQAGEKELSTNVARFFDLFLYQISLLGEILQAASYLIEEGKSKHLPNHEDLYPNLRFVENPVLKGIAENVMLRKYCESHKISWIGEFDIPRRIFNNFKSGKEYDAYMSLSINDFEKDKAVIVSLIRKYIVDFAPLNSFYEERSIYWLDDLDMANLILINTIKGFKEGEIDKALSNIEFNVEDDDRIFIKELFAKTIINSEKFDSMIAENALNWELERIAFLDIILMKMALVELTSFPSIPVKVTLNEYIELAKEYSTPKSSVFVNGVLDKLISNLKENKKIRKTGRGLK